MKLLVIDGNSILNRAFYGVRLLSTKDGRYTNGIFGFMNIFLHLLEEYKPDSVAVAFDVKAPTFRHEMYDEYKGTRKPAPAELIEQFPTLKELLGYLGYTVIEKPGYEADDILGTLSAACGKDDFCYIATGDRDSLQLVRDNVNVILASTKMGKSVTTVYDRAKIKETYGVEPEQLIDIKAIQGDTSDNIPGVAGIGEKGAQELIAKFGSVDYIYENLETIDIKAGIRVKLEASKDNAFLSKKLGTICLEAPIDRDIESYLIKKADAVKATNLLSSLEMTKLLGRLNFDEDEVISQSDAKSVKLYQVTDFDSFLAELKKLGKAYFTTKFNDGGIEYILFKTTDGVALVGNFDFMFMSFATEFFSDEAISKYTDNSKQLYGFCDTNGIEVKGIVLDTSLAAYLHRVGKEFKLVISLLVALAQAVYPALVVKLFNDIGDYLKHLRIVEFLLFVKSREALCVVLLKKLEKLKLGARKLRLDSVGVSHQRDIHTRIGAGKRKHLLVEEAVRAEGEVVRIWAEDARDCEANLIILGMHQGHLASAAIAFQLYHIRVKSKEIYHAHNSRAALWAAVSNCGLS